MFVYDGGLKLASCGVAVDFATRQACGFISHAHGDHWARHELAVCTTATAALYRCRLGGGRVRALDYGRPWQLGPLRLTTVPAGHMLGSAMLLVESEGRRLLYTGDFQLQSSRTAEPVGRLPEADVLVMESTFGQPQWRWPSREDCERQLLERIDDSWRRGRPPVVFAYAAGKAQEVAALLHAAGRRVWQHPEIAAISRVYSEFVDVLPPPLSYEGGPVEAGDVVLLPPRRHRARFRPCPPRATRIAVSGWGLDPRHRHRLEVDEVVPLSDHADFLQLLQCVERVAPQLVLCTHGPSSWVDELRRRGHNAHPLDNKAPRRFAEVA